MVDDTPTRARARLAGMTRHKGAGSPEVIEAKTNLAAAKISKYVREVVADAPALSDDQVARLSALLRPTTPAE